MSDVHFDFHGRNFVVVGASSGMGRQIALELAESGAHVLAIARNEDRLARLAAVSERIVTVSLDVMKAEKSDWKAALDEFVEAHGKFHGGVYTAGISGATPLQCFDECFARQIMETSYWGAVRFIQAASKKKYSEPAASLLVFASVAGQTGEKGLFAYSAAKAAIVAAVKSFAHDLARDKKRINTISPGTIQTEMTKRAVDDMGIPINSVGRHLFGIGTPQDVSCMALFLLSDRAHWITGQDFIVDGGYLRGAWN